MMCKLNDDDDDHDNANIETLLKIMYSSIPRNFVFILKSLCEISDAA